MMRWVSTLCGVWFAWGGGILYGSGYWIVGAIIGIVGSALVWLGWVR